MPIDGATDLHNLAALGAAASFAVLCLGIQLWARRLPRSLVFGSYASIAIEAIAMVGYDGIGAFNLTVFEIVAFTLVFAWLIALVAITHASPKRADAMSGRHLVRSRAARAPACGRAAVRPATESPARSPRPRRSVHRSPRRRSRTVASHDVRRVLHPDGERSDEPPDTS